MNNYPPSGSLHGNAILYHILLPLFTKPNLQLRNAFTRDATSYFEVKIILNADVSSILEVLMNCFKGTMENRHASLVIDDCGVQSTRFHH